MDDSVQIKREFMQHGGNIDIVMRHMPVICTHVVIQKTGST